jgi:hypothetical protein
LTSLVSNRREYLGALKLMEIRARILLWVC